VLENIHGKYIFFRKYMADIHHNAIESARVLRSDIPNSWSDEGRNSYLNKTYMGLVDAIRLGVQDDEKYTIYKETLLGPASTPLYRRLARNALDGRFSGGSKYTKRRSITRTKGTKGTKGTKKIKRNTRKTKHRGSKIR
jgi:hypothetical protein